MLEPLAPKFGDTPSIPIGCNRLQLGNRLQSIEKFGVSTILDGPQLLVYDSQSFLFVLEYLVNDNTSKQNIVLVLLQQLVGAVNIFVIRSNQRTRTLWISLFNCTIHPHMWKTSVWKGIRTESLRTKSHRTESHRTKSKFSPIFTLWDFVHF